MTHGFINVLKPPGMTSHDVVSRIRRITGIRKVGHTGTLDPDAAGVLPVALGHATRLVEYAMTSKKIYRAEITLGISTSTQDASGEILQKNPPGPLSREQLQQVMERFQGKIKQVPPMVSALKYHGRRLYELAWEGREVEREPREVSIYRLDLLEYWGETLFPRAMIEVECSGGTYIRSLCSDIGDMLGCGAHLSFLVRTLTGIFPLAESFTLEEIAAWETKGDHGYVVPADAVIKHFPSLVVKPNFVGSVNNGVPLPPEGIITSSPGLLPDQEVRVYSSENQFLAIGRVEWCQDQLVVKMHKVFK
ncbi:MAG: tRNA pseudouridine(55) synthase TruB [Bacillota bacterium]